MKRFTALFAALDRTTKTSLKVDALEAYFRDARPADAAWALHFLLGRRVRRAVSGRQLRGWVAEETGLPPWLVEECYGVVGDLAETVALLLPDPGVGTDAPLHRVIEERVAPLPELPEGARREAVTGSWGEMDEMQRLVWHKLITGAFRVGAGRKLVTRALARVAGVPPAVMAHRLTGSWDPTPAAWERIVSGEGGDDPGRPYPFFLAHPLEDDPASLGPVDGWQAEWKWDGIRAQLLRRRGQVLLWSRGEELVSDAFPELAAAGGALPDGTVLDGEVVAWSPDGPRPFGDLQRRLGRKRVPDAVRREVPVAFLAYDLLEEDGEDLRERTLDERRGRLEALLDAVRSAAAAAARTDAAGPQIALPLGPDGGEGDGPDPAAGGAPLRLSPVVRADSWAELAALREEARARGVEGLVLKRRDAPYGVGRVRGPWWKWKVEPLRLDAVLLYAQRGHGRRATLYTDYTFGVWSGDELVPVAKAYSGLTDKEIREVDRWVRRHTVERYGPVRSVEPSLVFELAFDSVGESDRHRSGVALRFPRMARWRRDKPAEEADTLEAVRRLLPGGADRP